MAELKTSYLGMELKNPLVVSPSPLSEQVDNIKRMEDAGAAAVVLHSLFEEQLTLQSNELNQNLMLGEHTSAESFNYFPEMEDYKMGPDGYLDHIRKAKEAVDIPIIGSLNGISTGGWTKYAKKIEEAGADALELNCYFIPADIDMTGVHVREMYEQLVKDVKSNVNIPVAVKVGPYFSAMAYVARRMCECGADGLVMFNRFYQPDFDLDNLEVKPHINLSYPSTLLLRLRWVAILYSRIKCDMAITGGVHSAEDVIKSMMAGAKVSMLCSSLLKNGIGHLTTLLDGVKAWMEEKEYDSIEQMQGSMSQKSVAEPAAFERANYMKALTEYTANL